MRRGHQGRVDVNQAEIVAALRQVPGVTILHLSAVGRGCPDICVGRKGVNTLLEIKAPGGPRGGRSHQALTDPEREWHRSWRGQAAIVTSIDQAFYACGISAKVPQAAQAAPGSDKDYRSGSREASQRSRASEAIRTMDGGMEREFSARLRGSDEHR